MQPIFARGNSRTLQRLKALRQEAQTDSATRVVLRLQAIMLSVQGRTTGQIAKVCKWIAPAFTLGSERGTSMAMKELLEGIAAGDQLS
jgi:hypothetical protein